MSSRNEAKRIFIGLILLSLGLVFTLVLPFGGAILFAMVLSGALLPLHRRLTRALRGRPGGSALLLCFGVFLLVLLPLAGLGAYAVAEIMSGVKFVTETVQSDGMNSLVARLPASLQGAARQLIHLVVQNPENLDAELKRHAGAHGGQLAQLLRSALAKTGNAAVQGAMSLVALYFLLMDGKALVSWIEDNSPLMRGQVRELLRECRNVSTAVLVSSVATSGVQALAALVGYGIAGVPEAFFFTLVTFFMAFIPAIGAGSVCVTAAALLLSLGKTWGAAFLATWGLLVVALVDNWVKPLLVKRGVHMHGGIVFFALFGGITVFGAVGLLLGPLIVTFFVALVRIYRRDFAPPSHEGDSNAEKTMLG